MPAVVGIVNCRNYELAEVEQAVERLITSLGGWQAFVRPGQTVLLKPNMIGPRPPEQAATTHPAVVQVIATKLREIGCTVWIGDSAGGAIGGIAPTAQALKVCGFEAAAQAAGAEIKSFDASGVVEVTSKFFDFKPKYHLAAPVFQADVVINLPKLKTHSAAIYTGALKNLFGLVPGLGKAEFHRQAPTNELFAEVIADINRNTPITLTIMDAVVGMEGAGPTAGDPREVGLLLASTDRVALDAVACRLIGLDPAVVPIVQTAYERGLGELAAANITFTGDYAEQPVVHGYRLPAGKKRSNPKVAKFMLNTVVNLFKTRPQVNQERCRKCDICVENCPVEAIDPQSKLIDYSVCIECLCCHELCPHGCVDLVRQNKLANALMGLARRMHK
ncbi:MAG: DUF362 domain-containing protein [Firmicutes bacterium]|nr:DUF362 domain-containing protein [Bacillota bacterium]